MYHAPVMISRKAVGVVGFVKATLRSGSESVEPVLHFTSGLRAEHQGSERGDHLKETEALKARREECGKAKFSL